MVRSTLTPHQTPSGRPPSCQLSRRTTPARTHSDYVQPSPDLRRSAAQSRQNTNTSFVPGSENESVLQSQNHQTQQSKKKRTTKTPSGPVNKSKHKKKNRATHCENESDEAEGAIDITQDSDQENSKSKALMELQALSSKLTLIDDVWTTKGNHDGLPEAQREVEVVRGTGKASRRVLQIQRVLYGQGTTWSLPVPACQIEAGSPLAAYHQETSTLANP
ncbi:hypothetical protein H4Q26_002323 [Puccinia striiformis f. sp. tritici PST-130]|uniref:Uncharacterized protein n=1 Tax=Puccinia striiformis f. sp. tritici PST-78 TaxID=1165861 RepID=A0A0L0W2P4_9BASI|nr:hypothetical protein H4Q26_002323 [Puccinia striiformis f. sp. tritici PST-130]KNF05813.1 hypothetical protein PSTG_01210 [Puccinia striiformis f. sp. tritici PST-78]